MSWVFELLAAFAAALFLRLFVVSLARIKGRSMLPTLHDRDFALVWRLGYLLRMPRRGDVVICHYPNRGRTFFVKRVVAVPGDVVYRSMGVTHVVYESTDENGQPVVVDEPLDAQYVSIFFNPGNDYEPYTLGEEEYFAVGDNRGNSHDSRDWNDSDPSRDVGPITKDMITGHVRSVIWPLNEIRTVE